MTGDVRGQQPAPADVRLFRFVGGMPEVAVEGCRAFGQARRQHSRNGDLRYCTGRITWFVATPAWLTTSGKFPAGVFAGTWKLIW